MPAKEELRQTVRDRLDTIIARVNAALRGENLAALEAVLTRLGRGGQLPHWYPGLKQNRTLPNLDGKTIGSVVEMLLVAVLETNAFASLGVGPLRINPARGVDLPDLDLGVKSPSENYCTSEPFFSPYERLLGSEFDAVVLLTDYQEAKKKPPLKLQIIQWKYLSKTQIADRGLCRLAGRHRDWLVAQNEARAKKFMRFLAYVNQGDWRAKRLLTVLDHLQSEDEIRAAIAKIGKGFEQENKRRATPPKRSKRPWKPKELIPVEEMDALRAILGITPPHFGVLDAADNWVVDHHADAARLPNENEWQRLLVSPLNGEIGMSVALQWRYNFGRLFGASTKE
jgi:hypothetical protein